MRKLLPVIVLLHAAVASAQITITDEVVSDPLRPRALPMTLAQPAVSLAKDRAGFAIAGVRANGAADPLDRIYVARLDANGQSTGVRAIAPFGTSPTPHQGSPSLAAMPGGKGFVLASVALDRAVPAALPTRARPIYCLLDAALTPSVPVALYPPLPTIAPAIARTKGDTTWISAVGQLWTVKNGAAAGPLNSIAASDMVVGTDWPQVIGGRTLTVSGLTCRCGSGFCPTSCLVPNPSRFILDFASILTTSMTKTFDFPSELRPAIGRDGRGGRGGLRGASAACPRRFHRLHRAQAASARPRPLRRRLRRQPPRRRSRRR